MHDDPWSEDPAQKEISARLASLLAREPRQEAGYFLDQWGRDHLVEQEGLQEEALLDAKATFAALYDIPLGDEGSTEEDSLLLEETDMVVDLFIQASDGALRRYFDSKRTLLHAILDHRELGKEEFTAEHLPVKIFTYMRDMHALNTSVRGPSFPVYGVPKPQFMNNERPGRWTREVALMRMFFLADRLHEYVDMVGTEWAIYPAREAQARHPVHDVSEILRRMNETAWRGRLLIPPNPHERIRTDLEMLADVYVEELGFSRRRAYNILADCFDELDALPRQ